MKLLSYLVNDLHGYIDVNLHFNNDLSIIVGGNGSGKTSALTLLASVLRMKVEEIVKTQFSSLEIRYEYLPSPNKKTEPYVISIKNEEEICTLSLSRGNEIIGTSHLNPGIKNFFEFDIENALISFQKSIPNLEINKKRIEKKIDIREIIESHSKVTFVRLDRTISAIDSRGRISFEDSDSKKDLSSARRNDSKIRDPLSVVRDVTSKYFIAYRNELENIKGKTYEQLFDIHFSTLVVDQTIRLDRLKKTLSELRRKLETSQAIKSSGEKLQKIEQYLSDTDSLGIELQLVKDERKKGRRTRLEEVLSAELTSRSQRIKNLIQVFEQESVDSATAYKALDVYLGTLNEFFKASRKILSFSLEDNQLHYGHLNAKAAAVVTNSNSDLASLSSGEKQIVIMLTYLAFLAEPGSIFIVDEPELSLHLAWQAKLVGALTELRPNQTQIILATHAPEIAGRAREKCMRLSKRSMKIG